MLSAWEGTVGAELHGFPRAGRIGSSKKLMSLGSFATVGIFSRRASMCVYLPRARMDKFGLREKKTDTGRLWGFRHFTGARRQNL